MRKLAKVTLVAAVVSILYMALTAVLSLTDTELSLRTWADVLGKMMIALVLPLLLVVMLALWVRQREWIHSVIKGIFTLAAGAAYLFWAYWAVLFIAFGVQDERMVAPQLLVTNEAAFLQESEYAYYRPAAFFFKIPAELTDKAKIGYLKKKYGREFMTDVSENGFLCDQELPDVKVSVYRSGMELNDDYVQQMALRYLTEGYKALGIKRGYHVAENYHGSKELYMEFDGEADIPALAGDVDAMIHYCMAHTDLFEEYSGNVGLSSDRGEHEIVFSISFGKRNAVHDIDSVAEVIAERYAYCEERYVQRDERAQQPSETPDRKEMTDAVLNDEQAQQSGGGSDETKVAGAVLDDEQAQQSGDGSDATKMAGAVLDEQTQQSNDGSDETKMAGVVLDDERARQSSDGSDETEMLETVSDNDRSQQLSEAETEDQAGTGHTEVSKDYVAEDAEALFDAILADEGFSYNIHYNAKGNFTLELGEKDGYNYSLVYDRPSKNGACELFVLYKFEEDTIDDYTIVDMYAVENRTKRVVASGRKHWSDVGTAEYREITE